jgi:hypothetical protein
MSFSRSQAIRNILIWCFLTGTGLGMVQETKASTNTPVLFVNQQPVSAEEFVWFMQQERAGVLQFVKAKFNFDYGTIFWDQPFSGGTPRILLRQRTIIDELVNKADVHVIPNSIESLLH